ncbi:MAG: hypothetical protein FJ297_19335 [Planctomycetes bacterium]|nr:hypothetical protein [Planctomycetota bacterium]
MSRLRRGEVIDESVVGIYHCWNRFVRQLHLAGVDPVTGVDRSERKLWFIERLEELAHAFLVDVISFAIMSTHYHLILRNRPDLAAAISDEDVVRRWRAAYPHRRDKDGKPIEPSDHEIRLDLGDPNTVAEWRRRLSSISWMAKCFSEVIAKRANTDDNVQGAFFAHRFKCTGLEDEAAVTACMAYVELNEIRARLAESPETSRHSSIWLHLQGVLARAEAASGAEGSELPGTPDGAASLAAVLADGLRRLGGGKLDLARRGDPDAWLSPIAETTSLPCLAPFGREAEFRADLPVGYVPRRQGALPVSMEQFLELVDWTGRQVHVGKAGVIPSSLAPILQRLGLRDGMWHETAGNFADWFTYVAGRAERMIEFATRVGLNWVRGLRRARQAFE